MPARVMIVEDDLHIAILLQYNFEAAGYEVEHLERGDGVEGRIADCAPDLLLLDWNLPGVSGIELCRRIRRLTPMERLPIIMLTARTDRADREFAYHLGANEYVTKPFLLSDIMFRANGLVPRKLQVTPLPRV